MSGHLWSYLPDGGLPLWVCDLCGARCRRVGAPPMSAAVGPSGRTIDENYHVPMGPGWMSCEAYIAFMVLTS